jgi:signal transduction histidine kinase
MKIPTKKIIICFVIWASAFSAFAQQTQIDSLKQLLSKSSTDTSRITLLVELSRKYYLQKPDSGLIYAEQALAISKKTGNINGRMRSLTQVGFSTWLLGDLPTASQSFITSLKIAEQLNDKWSIARNYDGISSTYSVQNEFKLAIANARKSEAIFREIKDYKNVVDELSGIGLCYSALGRSDSAMIVINQALKLSIKINEFTWRPQIITSLGEIYAQSGKRDSALYYLYKSVAMCKKYSGTFSLAGSYFSLAEVFEKFGQPDSCIFYAQKTFYLSQKFSIAYELLNAAKLLAQINYGNNDHEAAKYFKIALKMKDSLFNAEKVNQLMIMNINEQQHETDIKNEAVAYQDQLKLYSVLMVLLLVIIILTILWNNNTKQHKVNRLLEAQKQQIQKTLHELKATQSQLIQSEKMASLGELTAGIAHEIQNPLNFVNNFSEVNTELIDEMQQEIDEGDYEEVKALAGDIKENQLKISQHGKRADFIVKGMLQHSRTSTGERQETNINTLAYEFLKLSYHGLRAKDKSFDANMVTYFDENLPRLNVVQQDIGRVLLNLFNNAFYAVNQKAKTAGADYNPEVTVTSSVENGGVVIKVKDNGMGIPDAIKDKIMQPFFTTKPTGEGTGLGLSLSYDIVVKGHGGTINIDTKEGEFTTFTVSLAII